ncbi:Uncharacterised protein [Serratia proteamaculans]|uniref:hypothetical protein n=1 Tax=Serratia proteamaculans TaxID=28151 RepID=UPI0021835394|nr:hypothetical protein [Serratia proteamaculans]CAI2429550.1 Uncharacterised protein [Serratia proteamaculans]
MKLTTERLCEIADDGFLEHGGAKLMALELLAYREAQSVAEIRVMPMGSGRIRQAIYWFGKQDCDLPIGTKFYTAPPAPVLPTTVNFSENSDADMCRTWAWERVKEMVTTDSWDAGDSANFFSFFCWGWDMRRQYNEQRPPAVPRVTEIPEAATLTNINQLCPLDNNLSQTDFATGWNDCRQYAITNDGVPPVAQGWHSAAQGWNACRAAMLAAAPENH